MITLSVKQPWAYLLCSGIKNIENRSWRLPEKYKGQRVLIHASSKWDERHRNMSFLFTKDQWNALDEKIQRIMAGGVLPTSAIIGSVIFTDCVINHPSVWAETSNPLYCDGIKYVYNWLCKDPILFKEPILGIKGKLNFWDYNPVIVHPQLISHVLDNEIDTISL